MYRAPTDLSNKPVELKLEEILLEYVKWKLSAKSFCRLLKTHH